jgi:hypothetical protein
MSTTPTLSGRRSATAGVVIVFGGALTAAVWYGGQHGLAIGLAVFYAVSAVATYLWAGRDTDVAAALRAGGDERQRSIDRDATHVAALAMVTFALVGCIWSAATNSGEVGIFGAFAAVGGASYAVALAVLRRRR